MQVAAPEHPITRGPEAFTVFDEPWQKMVVNNPALHVLLTTTIPEAQRGTGQPAPLAMVIESGGGRCFDLVLDHTKQAQEHPAFAMLLRRGTEWAATGAVADKTTAGAPGPAL